MATIAGIILGAAMWYVYSKMDTTIKKANSKRAEYIRIYQYYFDKLYPFDPEVENIKKLRDF